MMLIEKAIDNLSIDSKIRAKSALSVLKNVDLMIEDFKIREAKSKADILLDVFGLLQGLFVAIDALYQLTFSTTKFKYHVNINQNKNLRMLKYLRNDIVGHPTNRNYEDGSFGFSIILDDEITREKLMYDTYIIKESTIEKKRHEIFFDKLADSYLIEKKRVINDLNNYLTRQDVKVESTGLIVKLYESAIVNKIDLNLIKEIKSKFLKEQNLDEDTSHRFKWHMDLLEVLINWKDDNYQDIIDYLVIKEILKLYQINLDLNYKKIRIPKIEHPILLDVFKQEINSNKDIKKFVNNLTEPDHPMYESSLFNIIDKISDEKIKRFLIWVSKINETNKKYLIGKELKILS